MVMLKVNLKNVPLKQYIMQNMQLRIEFILLLSY